MKNANKSLVAPSRGKFAEIAPGIVLCLVIAAFSWMLGRLLPVVGGAVFGIISGILFSAATGRLIPRKPFAEGIRFTSKKLLQGAVILLGFEMDMIRVVQVGAQSLVVMLFTLSAAFLTAWLMGKLLGVTSNEKILLGVGTAICGGSAIAATAPVIKAKDEEVAQAISTIFLFNILAVFLFPPLGHLFGLTDAGFGLWAGTAINDTSSVVAAGAAWSGQAGNNTALAIATIVKLTRTLMIVPITLVLAFYEAKTAKKGMIGSFSFRKVFPWFVLGFILTSCMNTFLPVPQALSGGFVTAGKFLIVMAMSAIGLNTDLKKLLANGSKPILLGLCCWVAVAAASLLAQGFSGLM
jgi:uncharacterized integral membrane protein (TIGR00698 family)